MGSSITVIPLLDVLDEDKFNVELVVQCVRVSDMPQTHHHALLLLGIVAGIFPVSTLTRVCVCVRACVRAESWAYMTYQ